MADNQQLFAELGLGGGPQEVAALRQAQQGTDFGSGQTAVFARKGEERRRRVAAGAESLLGGIIGAFKKDQTFIQGADSAHQRRKDRQLAQATGQDPQQIRKNRELRRRIGNIQPPRTSDPAKDQVAFLEEVIRVASAAGNFEVVTRANQKLLGIKRDQLEMRKAEIGNKAAEAEQKEAEFDLRRKLTTGIPIVPVGEDQNSEGFQPQHAGDRLSKLARSPSLS